MFSGSMTNAGMRHLRCFLVSLLVTSLLAPACLGSDEHSLAPLQEKSWTYYSNAQINEFVKRMQAEYPKHCRAYELGDSVDGNKIVSLTVSTKPDGFPVWPKTSPSSLTPSFLYVGGVHGDEPLGRQLMVYLAEELCSGAGKETADPDIHRILANGSVHLVFSMNPDGFDLKRRGNAHNVDLNRNFPDPIRWDKFPALTGKEEPETLALMRYVDLLGNSLVGGTHLHEGALVMVLPFDGNKDGTRSPNPTPDHKLFTYLGRRYVDVQPEMKNMYGEQGDKFPEPGMIQGSSWYPLWGGLQDFFYLKNRVYFTTIEMNYDKWPLERELPRLWSQHRASMYALLKAYLCQGLTVEVAFPPGAEEEEVLVTMLNPEMGRPVSFRSRTTHGVHYPVPPGNYSVSVEWRSEEVASRVVLSGEVAPDERTTLRTKKAVVVNPTVPKQAQSRAKLKKEKGDKEKPKKKEKKIRDPTLADPSPTQEGKSFQGTMVSKAAPEPVLYPFVERISIVVILLLLLFGLRYRSYFRRKGKNPRPRAQLSQMV